MQSKTLTPILAPEVAIATIQMSLNLRPDLEKAAIEAMVRISAK